MVLRMCLSVGCWEWILCFACLDVSDGVYLGVLESVGLFLIL